MALFAVIGLLALSPDADAARWQRDVVLVRDHTGGRRWGPIIAAAVDSLNVAMPPGAPRFVYQDAGASSCPAIRRTGRAIDICSAARLPRPAATWTTRRGETIRGALIVLRDDQIRLGRNRVCHELMHATTAVADAYQTESQSCVRGGLATFGPWDTALLTSECGHGRSRQS